MIAPTGRGCKSPVGSGAQIPARRIVRKPKSARHGIVRRIIILPYFRPATALLGCDKWILRWPGPFVPDSSAPSPPGRRDRACSQDSLSPYWANESWSFFFWGMSCGRFRAKHGRLQAQHGPVTCTHDHARGFRACANWRALIKMCNCTSGNDDKRQNSVQRRVGCPQHRAGLLAIAVLDEHHRGIDALAGNIFQRHGPAAG